MTNLRGDYFCCYDCFYITQKQSKDFPLSDYHTDYGCRFHNLHNGEVRWPKEQRCDDYLSKSAVNRNIKIDEILK